MKYQYKIVYLDNNKKEKHTLQSYSKMWIINKYINLLTDTNINISDLKIYKINVNTNKSREITQEINKFFI